MDDAFHKTILIVVLFAVFLGLANYFQYKVAPRRQARLRYRRRRPGTATDSPEGVEAPEEGAPGASSGPELELPPEPPPGGLLSRWSIWTSVLALLLSLVALGVMWFAARQ